jgi:hypothetical protein
MVTFIASYIKMVQQLRLYSACNSLRDQDDETVGRHKTIMLLEWTYILHCYPNSYVSNSRDSTM